MQPFVAVVIDLAAGTLVTLSVEWFEARFSVDDPGGAVSVHAVGGQGIPRARPLSMLICFPAACPARPDPASLRQRILPVARLLVGIATLLDSCFSGHLRSSISLLGLAVHYRVPPEAEEQGLDLYELGAGAYPEFVTHTDEFSQR